MLFTYIARELRRRKRQAFVVSVGLALGVALVVTVSAMAAGVRDAQGQVLQSLYGVGTDITVTQAPSSGTGGPARLGLNANDNQAGKRFSRDDILQSPGLGTIPASRLATISSLPGVKAASGGLSLSSIHAEGRFPDFGASTSTGQGPTSTPSPAPSIAPVKVSSFSITGVEVSQLSVGPLSGSKAVSGRLFEAGDANA